MTHGQASPALPWYELVVKTIALKGWTKAQLTERSGIHRSTIENWRTNPRPPQARAVNSVADVLGIDRARALRLAGVITDVSTADRSPPSLLDERLGHENAEIIRSLLRDEEPDRADAIIAGLEDRLRQRASGHG